MNMFVVIERSDEWSMETEHRDFADARKFFSDAPLTPGIEITRTMFEVTPTRRIVATIGQRVFPA